MSQNTRRDADHGDYDPGGSRDSRSSPSAFEFDLERLLHANKLHKSQKVGCDGRIDCINFDVYTPNSIKTPCKHLDEGTTDSATARSLDLGYNSMLHTRYDEGTTPVTEHTLDDIVDKKLPPAPSIAAKLILSHGLSADPGYGSLRSADFSSIGSSVSGDSGFPSDSSVTMRGNVNTKVTRPSSDITTSTSTQRLGSRSESWHEHSSRQKLRVFAEKMNYTESEFEQCMAELGEDGMDPNKLLGHLVKVRDSKQSSPQKTSQKTTPSATNLTSSQNRSEGDSKGLRRIVIDGSNVAMEHGLHQIYSCRGIEIVVKYFQERGHEFITVFVPAHRLRSEKHQTKDQHILKDLSRTGVVVKTPSRRSSKGNIASYEDRFILKLATTGDAIVVSNDQFRDLKSESSSFRETIEKRILPFVFANDQFIPAEDPLGKRGPTLEQFLRVNPHNTTSGTCPYGRKCTYGTKCRYGHPEKEDSYDSALGETVRSAQYVTSSLSSSTDNPSSGAGAAGGSSSSGGQHPEYWANRQIGLPMVSQSRSPYLPQPPYSYMMNSTATANHHPVSNTLPNCFMPIDSRPYNRGSRFAAEYPPVGVAYPPLASRACLHATNDESYMSVPLDDLQYHSRRPMTDPHSMPSSAQGAATSVQGVTSPTQNVTSLTQDMTSQPSTSSSNYKSAAPMPLNENIFVSSSQHSTFMAEGRLPPSQSQIHAHDKAIADSDPRYNMYYHLKNLFSERIVRRVMNKYPNETDPNKITAEVLRCQSRATKVANISC